MSSRVFFDGVIVSALEKVAAVSSPVLTYLATEIASGENRTPYSMVSGVGPELNAIVGSEITDEEIVLSQWLADDLAAKPGDKVTLV